VKGRSGRPKLPPWLSQADTGGIVMSARIRLARNVAEAAFPGWAGAEEGEQLCRRLLPVLQALPPLKGGSVVRMEEASTLDRQILHERHLISTELMNKGAGSALVLGADETLSVMINEEDHLRLQGLAPGADLAGLWALVDALDTALAAQVSLAVTPRLGYLTACPSNVGTGLRASVMLHLPGLRLAGDAERVVKGLGKLGMAARGLLGEGTDASGCMYQISNQITLGEREADIIARLSETVGEIIRHETRARQRLAETRPSLLKDRVLRAVALLTHARLISAEEALDLLSAVRLGLAIGFLKSLEWKELDELFLWVQPAHLQRQAGRDLPPEERDEARAGLLRERLSAVEWI
jgi:protein arginine kinase